MPHTISAVEADSIASQLDLRPGDRLVSINGQNIIDWIDYQALCSEDSLTLVVERDGEETEYTLEKDDWEPLGLTFDSPLMTQVRECVNKCVFCFVDQLPENVRPSLRVKDDDWRLSLMTGSFVTLTNVSDAELDRIIRRHASPLYVSVHATDPDLRVKMLGQPLAAKLMKQLNRLKNGGIAFHTQAVLCPNLNDGAALEKTINDLAALWPACQSLALVPVGLTGCRDGLCPLRKYTKAEARAVLDIAEKFQKKFLKKFDTAFVFPSDEFYLAAGRAVPEDAFYEDYAQIDNGIGLLRLLETELAEAYEEADLSQAAPARLVIATGTSAAPFMKSLMRRFELPNVEVEVRAVENHFFGPDVTVAGLLTGSDLMRALKGVDADRVLITECMLRDGEDVFLDDITPAEVEREIGVPLVKVGRRGDELLAALMGQTAEAAQ